MYDLVIQKMHRKGRRLAMSDQKSVVTIRISDEMKSNLQRAADEKGGNLSAEILHRLAEFERLRRLVDDLLDDVSSMTAATGIKGVRDLALTMSARPEPDKTSVSLHCAMIVASCMEKLFARVAQATMDAYVGRARREFKNNLLRRIEAGDLTAVRDPIDPNVKAREFSEDIASIVQARADELFRMAAPMVGKSIWDACFDKDDPLRSTSEDGKLVASGQGLMASLDFDPDDGLYDGLWFPDEFLPLSLSDDQRIALAEVLLARKGLRRTAELMKADGMFPGMTVEQIEVHLHTKLPQPERSDREMIDDVDAEKSET